MKKVYIIWTAIFAILLSICIVRIGQIFFTIYLYYDYAIWCDKEDKDYIKSHSYINSNFNIAVADINWNTATEEAAVMSGYPSVFTKKINIKSSVVTHYVRENNNQSEVFWKCSFPYIMLSVALIILFYKKILPKL